MPVVVDLDEPLPPAVATGFDGEPLRANSAVWKETWTMLKTAGAGQASSIQWGSAAAGSGPQALVVSCGRSPTGRAKPLITFEAAIRSPLVRPLARSRRLGPRSQVAGVVGL